jgi:hypothetical protein
MFDELSFALSYGPTVDLIMGGIVYHFDTGRSHPKPRLGCRTAACANASSR